MKRNVIVVNGNIRGMNGMVASKGTTSLRTRFNRRYP